MSRRRSARKKHRKAGAGGAPKPGTPYEQLVAEVVRAMDERVFVEQGLGLIGPDGRRDADVLVTGNVDGIKKRVLIECKDRNPGRGPVGIEVVDCLASKREDLGIDAALICSNAGFTEGAVRKASRKGIKLVGVLKSGDARVRFVVEDVWYPRDLTVKRLEVRYEDLEPTTDVTARAGAVRYDGRPVEKWISKVVSGFLGANLITRGAFKMTHRFRDRLTFEDDNGSFTAGALSWRIELEGSWIAQTTTYDATNGLYDYLRHVVRVGSSTNTVKWTVRLDENKHLVGEPVESPPDWVLSRTGLGETGIGLGMCMVDGLPGNDMPSPDLWPHIIDEDHDLMLEG